MAKAKPSLKKSEQESVSLPMRVRDYFVSLKYEWQKVTFPTRKALLQSTTVVFLFTIVLMLVISLYDAAMSFLFTRWILPID